MSLRKEVPNGELQTILKAYDLFGDIVSERSQIALLGYREAEGDSLYKYAAKLLRSGGRIGERRSGHELVLGNNEGVVRNTQMAYRKKAQDVRIFESSQLIIYRTNDAPVLPEFEGLPDDELLRLHLISHPQDALASPVLLSALLYKGAQMRGFENLLITDTQRELAASIAGNIDLHVQVFVDALKHDFKKQSYISKAHWDEHAPLLLRVQHQQVLPPTIIAQHVWRRLNIREDGGDTWLPIGLSVQRDRELRDTIKSPVPPIVPQGGVIFSGGR